MEQIFCNPAFAHILESILLQLEPKDLKNCRKVNTNFRNVLDQPRLWFKINQARGVFEYDQNLNSWETLVKLTSRTPLGKNVAKILINLNDIVESFKFYPLRIKIPLSFTPLHMVAHQGSDLELMEFLVDNLKEFGYETFDQCLDENKYHPLHEIMRSNGNIEMIKLLIENMENVDIKCTNGKTPLHYAIKPTKENLEVVKLLLANGANPESKDCSNCTPIFYARIARHEKTLDYFFNFLGKENPYKKVLATTKPSVSQ